MKILALELSSARGSIAWLDEGGEPFAREFPNDRKHSGLFFQNLQECSKQFGLPDMIVAGLGPGSYAGVRIAIAAASGLKTASGARLAGIPSVCAMPTEAEEFCVIGDARRQSWFFARVRRNELVEGPSLYEETALREKMEKVGRDVPVLASEELRFERAKLCYPSALLLAQIGRRGENLVSAPLEPIYLREPHITTPRKNEPSLR